MDLKWSDLIGRTQKFSTIIITKVFSVRIRLQAKLPVVGCNINVMVSGSGRKIQGKRVEVLVPLFVDIGALSP